MHAVPAGDSASSVAVPAGDSASSVAVPAHRSAETSVPIHAPIAARWSPRAFDSTAEVSDHDLRALLEAARWAATWGRRQPVRFLVGRRADDVFVTLSGLLKRGNQYANAAGALILLCAHRGADENTARYSGVDAGAAMANLSIEAVSRGLIVHPMAGFDARGATEAFDLPDDLRPLIVIAVGTLGDYAEVAPEIADRDRQPRERLPLDEIVLNWRERPGT
ncbi:nitroreductase [Mycolicibacterium cyprinidarum]|uniref:Nitroreductase n=1 Tax=Mycolicibacterium cyprinidarum TaxID=2860311 RepID=A0ABQ4V3Y8_9MYCO|nr:nitroreductase [Mycolicibacterium sp. NGTWSNA01]GJF20189.1 nitroreductase [Mycolicibacterium sp. NGTWS0302]